MSIFSIVVERLPLITGDTRRVVVDVSMPNGSKYYRMTFVPEPCTNSTYMRAVARMFGEIAAEAESREA